MQFNQARFYVMRGLDPRIQRNDRMARILRWMAGSSPAMTIETFFRYP
jgi:hypothetical protein